MAIKHLKGNPHYIDEYTWWYEDNGGISIVTEVRFQNGSFFKTVIKKISWRALRGSLARKDKK